MTASAPENKIETKRNRIGWTILLFSLITPLFILLIQPQGYDQEILPLLRTPKNSVLKLDLAKRALKAGDKSTFDMLIAEIDSTISKNDNVKVLGVNNRVIMRLKGERDFGSREDVMRLIETWREKGFNYGISRDQLLKLAVLHARIGEMGYARAYLNQAYSLDPNSEKVIAVERWMNN